MADDLTELAGTVAGPPDTPYAGGKFKLEIKIPDTYPFNPPKVIFYVVVKWFYFPSFQVRFITKIWHPNVSSVTGAICLDILKDQWAAAMTLRTVLLSVQVGRDQTLTQFVLYICESLILIYDVYQALLAAPEPDDPQDAVVARQVNVHCWVTAESDMY